KVVVAMKLLTDTTGKKMGKTENNAVAMTDSPVDIFGKVMSWTDGMILPALEICTDLSLEEIEIIKKNLEQGGNPRDAKLVLAEEVVKLILGGKDSSKTAAQVKENFLATFQKGEVPENVKTIEVDKGKKLKEILVAGVAHNITSGSAFVRLIKEGAISNAETREKIFDANSIVEKNMVLKVGKKEFIKIVVR
ncbi:MAG: hypothetical protein PHF79_04055, partial [Candidatus Pacebacteria bacterium]|nr:hypothetical protein [Candidatus Paceibacterota bacterium]